MENIKQKALVRALITLANNMPTVQRMAKEIINKFFPDIEMPDFKFVKHTFPKWLGSSKVTRLKDKADYVVYLQRSILDDEKTLHRVLAHELIHIWQYQTLDLNNKSIDFHGESFEDMAAKMNEAYGKDYVTKTSDLSYVESGDKEFHIVIQPHDQSGGKQKYGVTKFVRPSAKQKEELKKRIEKQDAHVFKTKDLAFEKAAPLKKYGGYSVYPSEEIQNKLKELYQGQNIDRKFI